MKLTLAVFGASLALAGCATGPEDQDHAAHHPLSASVPAPAATTPGQMDSMMKSMKEMHVKVMAAKTPEERAKLMQEHMTLMQDNMATMGRMHGVKGGMGMDGGMPMNPEAMGKRMDMMEMMMQMMMDREAMKPPAAK
jgi:outer membrane murein-binding lipoprotein Lpp